jgi:endonuclease YncB( thermonuclease family)
MQSPMQLRSFLIAAAALMVPAVAHADPCEGALPRHAGETFAGAVRYIGDGDSLCVGADPNTWIEVRLADFNAPELHDQGGQAGKAALEHIAMGHQAQCVAGGGRSARVVSYDRVIATCRVNGRRIGDLLREAGAEEGGR